MAAYVISEVEILDEEAAGHYRRLAEASILDFGGTYLVRGAEPIALQGEWSPARRLVIVQFPDADAVRRWYASPAYAEALAYRDRALTRRLIVAEGAGV